jgi:LemA protein
MLLWIIIAIAAAIAIYAIVLFNRLVRTRQMVNEAWSGIDVQLKRRSDLVPNLVQTVKGYAAHERSVIEEVTELRGAARTVSRMMWLRVRRPKGPCRPRLADCSHSPKAIPI